MNKLNNIFDALGLNKGHERTIKAKKNIIASFFIKGGNILTSILMVPLTINYINPTGYGIWLTLSSIIGWFSFFDIGLGNGLRNKLAESIAEGNMKLAKVYVSTTFAYLIIIIIPVLFIFLFINFFLNWTVILNAPIGMEKELGTLATIVIVFFCLRFIFQPISVIFLANQATALSSVIGLISNILSLLLIYALTRFTHGSLILLGSAYGLPSVIVFLIANIFFFKKKYKAFSPSFKSVDFSYTKNLMGLGAQFFVIQIAAVIVFSLNNVLIAQLFDPNAVAQYNISYKYFSVATMGFTILIAPFWSAFTDAYVKKELVWIKNAIKKLAFLWIVFVIVIITMLTFSKFLFHLWIGDKITIPFILSISMSIYVILSSWNYIYVSFLNGIGKIRLQLFASILEAVSIIPLSLLFVKVFKMNVEGIVLVGCIPLLVGAFWTKIQYEKIINNKSSGIWSK